MLTVAHLRGPSRGEIVIGSAAIYAAGYGTLAALASTGLNGPALPLLGASLAVPPLLAVAGAGIGLGDRSPRPWTGFAGGALILVGGFPALASAFVLLFFAPRVAFLVAPPVGALAITLMWVAATLAWFVALVASVPRPSHEIARDTRESSRKLAEFSVHRRDLDDA